MIVKNEAPVIARCLASVRPLIDHFMLVDTGSTDGTQRLAWNALTGLPGTIMERPWVDFGHNRSEALTLARPLADFALIIDADDEFVIPEGFVMPDLDAHSYVVDILDNSITYRRPQLVANALPWRYAGVLHEFLTCAEASSVGHLPIVMRRNHDGRRRRDPATYRNDAGVLERALAVELDPHLVARYTFYLAQSYRDCGDRNAAIDTYLRRATLGFWDQEVFISLLEAARLMEAGCRHVEEVIAVYERASAACPARAEASHGASRLCRVNGRHDQGYDIAKRAVAIQVPADGLFVERWIYDYGLRDELAVNAYWTGRYADCRVACRDLLARTDLPAADRDRVAANARFAEDRIAEKAALATPDWRPTRAQGGTELMVDGLRKRLGKTLDAINLRINLFDETCLDDRPLVVWIHHDIDQAAVQWLCESDKTSRVNWFVFVSAWQMARFVERFQLRAERCVVLRNATATSAFDRPWAPRCRPYKLAYASAPYRGLSVLLEAWERLAPRDAELHIWSSHKLYGPGFDDQPYARLYERARTLPNVTYHGIVPHDALRDNLRNCDFLAYPSTFRETSCLAAIEAMAAGCRVICPDHGALPSTVGRFGRLYPFSDDLDEHARRFAAVLEDELQNPWAGDSALAVEQQAHMRENYDWSRRVEAWRHFIVRAAGGASSGRPRTATSDVSEVSAFQALSRLKARGFTPSGIIDAGAYRGHFASALRPVFPDAHILMIDALIENEPALAKTALDIGNASSAIALLGADDFGAQLFFVADTTQRPDLVKTGSSKFREKADFPMEERRLRQRRLDQIIVESRRSFQMIKLDIQGAEIEVLEGLGVHLGAIEVVLMEMSLVDYNDGAPLIETALTRLSRLGFLLSEIVEQHRYRDGSLLQIDGIFLRPDSKLRSHLPFWS